MSTKPDAPAPVPDKWQLVPVEPTPEMVEAARDVKRRRLLRAVEDTKAGREPNTMGAAMACDEEWRAMLAAAAAAPRPAPAEPQGAEAPQEIKSLRDRIIEGELELDGTHPPTLMFLMAEHWKAVATERYAKAKDYDRLKHELRLSRAAPAPQPAGGEPVARAFFHAHEGWKIEWLGAAPNGGQSNYLYAPSQPAAQQEPVAHMWQHPETGMTGFVEHASPDDLAQWERMNRPRKIVAPLYTQPAAKPLTDEQIRPHIQRICRHHGILNGVLEADLSTKFVELSAHGIGGKHD